MPQFIVQSDVTAQIAPTTVLLIALQTNSMVQTLREAMGGRLTYTPINQFSWLCIGHYFCNSSSGNHFDPNYKIKSCN
jgi:hypothetical protein